MKAKMKKSPVGRIRILLGGALLATLMGCVGYVGGGYSGSAVVVADPDVYVFGGGYERGRDVHDFSHRGAVSRAVAHPAPHPAPHAGGGPGDRR
jgi:hypothetical protein